MKIINSINSELYLLENFHHDDQRGSFSKVSNDIFFNAKPFECLQFNETFYSISHENVFRGMHFQINESKHKKLVSVVRGSILDVVVNINPNSINYKKFYEFKINASDNQSIFIGDDFAHGFLSLENDTTVLYQTTTSHSYKNDKGIKYDSFGYKWPNQTKMIISDRDLNHPSLDEYEDIYNHTNI